MAPLRDHSKVTRAPPPAISKTSGKLHWKSAVEVQDVIGQSMQQTALQTVSTLQAQSAWFWHGLEVEGRSNCLYCSDQIRC
jgi:wobble nucleotide-excising tRNase